MFIKLKPPNVRTLKVMERIVCCCTRCENIKLKLKSLNSLITKSFTDDPTTAKALKLENEHQLSNLTVCPCPKGECYPNQACLDRTCNLCGTSQILTRYRPLQDKCDDIEVNYNFWDRVTEMKQLKSGEKKITSMQLLTKSCTLSELLHRLSAELTTFTAHLFRAQWQQKMFAAARESMPPKSAVTVVDFAENYTCGIQAEAQSHHWHQQQVTIHPVMSYINSTDEVGPPTQKEAIIFVSDDRKHDAAAVDTFRTIAYKQLKDDHGITLIKEYSDCCSSQYRGRTSFADLSFASQNINLEHHYFESLHGKAAADGISAIVKHNAKRAVTNGKAVIRNAKEMFEYCQENLTVVGDSVFNSRREEYTNSKRSFVYVPSADIVRARPDREVITLKGSMQLHSVKGCGKPYELKVRNLSCFCARCALGDGDTCLNLKHVDKWKDVKLKPLKCARPIIDLSY